MIFFLAKYVYVNTHVFVTYYLLIKNIIPFVLQYIINNIFGYMGTKSQRFCNLAIKPQIMIPRQIVSFLVTLSQLTYDGRVFRERIKELTVVECLHV